MSILSNLLKKNKQIEHSEQLTIQEKVEKECEFRKKKLIIESMESVDEIKFGMKRDIIHSLWGEAKGFKKNQYFNNLTDDYGFCHIYYDDNDCLEAIEIFDNKVDIFYEDTLLSKKYSEILKMFRSKFNDIKEDENGFISKEGSIGVYIENDEDKVDSILFGKKDYYN